MRTALTAEVLYTPLDTLAEPVIIIRDGCIERMGSREEIEIPGDAHQAAFPGAVLAPGLIDIHIHGAASHDVMAASPEEFTAMERFMAAHGVTGYCPTSVTAPLDATFAALERIAAHIGSHRHWEACARPLGIHLEGPFISHAKRGVHPPEYVQAPSVSLFKRLHDAARGRVSLLTIAPELPGASEVIAEAAGRGVCVSLGHSNADLDSAREGITAGARHATHTFNAMTVLDHRSPGLLGAVLTDDRLTADIIADGVHVHPAVVALFLRAKGPERAVLITDGISSTGMPDGRYRLGPFEVEVADGRCMSEGRLAGSLLTLDRAVRNVMSFAGWRLAEALRLATLNPARVLGLDGRGVLSVGADADIIVLSPAGDVIRTFVGGVGN